MVAERDPTIPFAPNPEGSPFNFLVRWILDLWVALARLFYTLKYGAISRRLGLAKQVGDPMRRGFVVVQIDGLSHQDLLRAMDRGYAPYLKKLLATGGFRLARYRCGLPSTTPAAQAGIMFGDNFDVPAFRWYEKETQSVVVPRTPGLVQALQERLSQGRPGILKGGSSYVNLMDGGADFSLFTLGGLNKGRLFAGVQGLGLLVLILLSPWRVLCILLLSFWEYLVQMVEGTLARFSRQPRVSNGVLFPFVRIVTNVLFRELQTFAVIIDLYRGVPAIYTNYYGYDEIAHCYGPDSRPAYRALRGIDRQIKQIDRMRRYSPRRRYDLYVLSDHGQTPTLPFRQLYGCTLGQYIARHDGRDTQELVNGEEVSRRQAQYLISELEALERQAAKPPAALARRARRLLERRMLGEDQGEEIPKGWEIEVLHSGSLAHVYFNSSTRQLTWSEIERLYPGLVGALVRHKGVGLVVVRSEEGVYVLSSEGKALLDGRNGADEVLSRFEEPKVAEAQLRYLASFPHSGDLIVFGAYRDGRVVGFEEQVGSHGGLGGPQGYPFILYPSEYRIDTEGMINAKELYPHFIKTYQNGEQRRGT
ncbi:MAG TPA: hypothetical protein EYP55_00010 [Anaerolineae bacterium]|nr:hypothetical protein [Anaerolineae bacterium]